MENIKKKLIERILNSFGFYKRDNNFVAVKEATGETKILIVEADIEKSKMEYYTPENIQYTKYSLVKSLTESLITRLHEEKVIIFKEINDDNSEFIRFQLELHVVDYNNK